MDIEIPARLKKILERDPVALGATSVTLKEFSVWVNHSTRPFFPEYTDHGVDHINGVLRSADALMADSVEDFLTANDAMVLILSVLLHDIAIHVNEDSFYFLLEAKDESWAGFGVDDDSWSELWTDFYLEAKRYSAVKLRSLFGVAEPVGKLPETPLELSKKDRLLIGEFLRRHHPRLAWEIAINGTPLGVAGERLKICNVAPDLIEIIGMVAYSHGTDLREAVDLMRKYDAREYKGVHAVYLMTLIRIADYVQVQSERAPDSVMRVQRLSSPISNREWQTHSDVNDVRNTHEDPEALFIDASPTSAKTLFNLKSWLRGIQYELDSSWAVLGEVYGRYAGLQNLGLRIRRVRSNIDQLSVSSTSLSFVPIKAKFSTANAELLKLLIGPLYGQEPSIGIRELVQNAVDAVIEREALDPTFSGGRIDVFFEDDEDEKWIVVKDNGVGMKAETIRDYFLTAGASFRASDEWKAHFCEASGESKVRRSGRFGVGALAGYLLGNKMTVLSRHCTEEYTRSVFFEAELEEELIELKWVASDVGTTIKVRISDDTFEALTEEYRGIPSWDWFCFSVPNVHRWKPFGCDKEYKSRFQFSSDFDQLGNSVNVIEHDDFEGIAWTYSQDFPELSINGFKIKDANGVPQELQKANETYGLRMPNLIVKDKDGRFPLNLQRSGVSSEIPFTDSVRESVISNFSEFFARRKVSYNSSEYGWPFFGKRGYGSYRSLSEFLKHRDSQVEGENDEGDWVFSGLTMGRYSGKSVVSDIVFTPGGWVPANRTLLNDANISEILLVHVNPLSKDWKLVGELVNNGFNVLPLCGEASFQRMKSFVVSCSSFKVDSYSDYYREVRNLQPIGCQLILPPKWSDDLNQAGVLNSKVRGSIQEIKTDSKLAVWSLGSFQDAKFSMGSCLGFFESMGSVWTGAAYLLLSPVTKSERGQGFVELAWGKCASSGKLPYYDL